MSIFLSYRLSVLYYLTNFTFLQQKTPSQTLDGAARGSKTK